METYTFLKGRQDNKWCSLKKFNFSNRTKKMGRREYIFVELYYFIFVKLCYFEFGLKCMYFSWSVKNLFSRWMLYFCWTILFWIWVEDLKYMHCFLGCKKNYFYMDVIFNIMQVEMGCVTFNTTQWVVLFNSIRLVY